MFYLHLWEKKNRLHTFLVHCTLYNVDHQQHFYYIWFWKCIIHLFIQIIVLTKNRFTVKSVLVSKVDFLFIFIKIVLMYFYISILNLSICVSDYICIYQSLSPIYLSIYLCVLVWDRVVPDGELGPLQLGQRVVQGHVLPDSTIQKIKNIINLLWISLKRYPKLPVCTRDR